ncbi:MAG: coenzyme F420-0:L-glutamate ligase [Candidatus Thorarchaeota archaeon]
MQLFPLPTPLITSDDDLFEIIDNALSKAKKPLQDGDVLTVSSKIVSVTQGLLVKRDEIEISDEARKYAEITKLPPEFMEVSIRESDEVLGACWGALMTTKDGNVLPNAGADQSNAPEGVIILLPRNPSQVAEEIRQHLQQKYHCKIGVIIGDSRVQPLRRGTSGLAIGVAGFVPVIDDRGRKDLFGRVMKMTRRAIADNLMSAAEILSGEVDEKVPFVLIRGAPIILTDEDLTNTMSIPPNECMYFSTFMPKK